MFNRWVIKVRVTNKSPIKTWSNSRGEGKLFSMDLIDESGEIRCTAFRDQCEKFYDMIEVYFFILKLLKLVMVCKFFSTMIKNYWSFCLCRLEMYIISHGAHWRQRTNNFARWKMIMRWLWLAIRRLYLATKTAIIFQHYSLTSVP